MKKKITGMSFAILGIAFVIPSSKSSFAAWARPCASPTP